MDYRHSTAGSKPDRLTDIPPADFKVDTDNFYISVKYKNEN